MLHAAQARRVGLIAIYSFAVHHHERDLLASILEEAHRDPLLEQMILLWHIDEPLWPLQWQPPVRFFSL
jgi:hypothetical protein